MIGYINYSDVNIHIIIESILVLIFQLYNIKVVNVN